jgi:hypothetical protein
VHQPEVDFAEKVGHRRQTASPIQLYTQSTPIVRPLHSPCALATLATTAYRRILPQYVHTSRSVLSSLSPTLSPDDERTPRSFVTNNSLCPCYFRAHDAAYICIAPASPLCACCLPSPVLSARPQFPPRRRRQTGATFAFSLVRRRSGGQTVTEPTWMIGEATSQMTPRDDLHHVCDALIDSSTLLCLVVATTKNTCPVLAAVPWRRHRRRPFDNH